MCFKQVTIIIFLLFMHCLFLNSHCQSNCYMLHDVCLYFMCIAHIFLSLCCHSMHVLCVSLQPKLYISIIADQSPAGSQMS